MTFFIDITDKRNQILKKLLENKAHKTENVSEKSKIKQGDVLVFAPNKKFEDHNLFAFPTNTKLICGNLPTKQIEILNTKQIKYLNVLKDEVFAMQNSWLTAEGILALILEKSPKSIYQNKILVLGSGRVGKATAVLLTKMGITNFALTSSDPQNYATDFLFTNHNFFGASYLNHLHEFDVIINTVPDKIIPETHYNKIAKECLFLEIASIQSIDASKANFNYLLCPALPQKYSPETAAQVFLNAIEKML